VPDVRLQDLAETLGRRFTGDGQFKICGVAALESAGPGDLVYVRDASHMDLLSDCPAGAVILPDGFDPGTRGAIYSSNPQLDFARAIESICPEVRPPAGVDPRAFVAAGADIANSASVGPGASIGERTRIGERCVVHPNATLYPDVVLGAGCVVHAGVVIREGSVLGERVILQPGVVIGGDGFGYVPDDSGALHKVPQIGCVVIGDDVEVGANTTIDRAALTQTALGDRVKLDNLIQVAHGCRFAPDVVVAAQSGFSGSTQIGRGTIVMAQVGVAGHLEIGTRAFLGARAGLHKSVPDYARVYGTPQMEDRRWHRAMAALKRLPEMLKRLRAVERKLGLRGQADSPRVALPDEPHGTSARDSDKNS
jgi:UDP-3-O-[3-hydroxymyristoyl] glucosamine N-acyltransferase